MSKDLTNAIKIHQQLNCLKGNNNYETAGVLYFSRAQSISNVSARVLPTLIKSNHYTCLQKKVLGLLSLLLVKLLVMYCTCSIPQLKSPQNVECIRFYRICQRRLICVAEMA